ncbi:3'-5' exonuclease [Kribbella caucasensis]|uniref:3'-5' exonuclease n=1 Tax=Kribbella caucasensis TaxID=2512215 RepID=UPI00105FBE73
MIQRPPRGPTHIHGIRGADVLDAPRFIDIAGDVADLLTGSVVVAHNARFDLGFVTAEYQRIGATPPAWPALCTLGMSYRLGRFGGGRLANCLAAEGLGHPDAHSALGDCNSNRRTVSDLPWKIGSSRGHLTDGPRMCTRGLAGHPRLADMAGLRADTRPI